MLMRSKPTTAIILFALTSSLFNYTFANQAQIKDTLFVLDASGSMWGQIDGINKIVIAKDVMEELVWGLPDTQRIGLVAYGHRKKADCADIETLSQVGATREAVVKQLRAVSPKGKTPLTASVAHAATALNYKNQAATVILVSDGLENCDADPCALARTLEQQGLDFTVHVVGFDVTESERQGLQCIAEETGGSLMTAQNAQELAQALTTVAAVTPGAPEPLPSKVILKATLLQGGPLLQRQVDWSVLVAGTDKIVHTAVSAGITQTELAPGEYIAIATWRGWANNSELTGQLSFSVAAQQPRVITVPINMGLAVTMSAPDSITAAKPFEVSWRGPDTLGAYIYVTALDDSPRDYIYGTAAAKARSDFATRTEDKALLDSNGDGNFDDNDLARVEIGGPSIAGNYEVRYVLDQPRVILARQPILVTGRPFSLSAPTSASVASTVNVQWSGDANPDDFISIVKADSASIYDNKRTVKTNKGQTLNMQAPATPGEYEIRYILTNGYTLYEGMQHTIAARAPLSLTDISVPLSAPDEVVGGSTITVEASDVAGFENDMISIIPAGTKKFNREAMALRTVRGVVQPDFSIQVPNVPGKYEIAYFLEPGRRLLSSKPLNITQAKATLRAPVQIAVGESFDVQYSGPNYKGDRVVVVPADRPAGKMWNITPRYGFLTKEQSGSGTVTAYPTQAGPGAYEVRYVTGLQHHILARAPIKVIAEE
ncbi:MAG: VWA domain-containing protein [Pseudomonadales bacterium]|jgi:Ca-activated chloride channel family protein|nr:VWA domain-containing protein [Pseudomonadales bacterium]